MLILTAPKPENVRKTFFVNIHPFFLLFFLV